jgi:hypothetical protein
MPRIAGEQSIRGRRGASQLYILLVTAFGVAVFFLVGQFIPPYVDDWKLGKMFKSIAAKGSTMETAEAVKTYGLKELAEQGFLFKPKELTITKEGRIVRIKASYDREVDIPFIGLTVSIHFTREQSNAME